MNIRLEQPGDYRAVENLTREAFWNVYRPGCMEHCVLHKLRQDPCFVPELSYVLEEEGQILAHIAYAKGRLRTPQGETRDLLLFGPVSVDPSRQKQGYGSRLIRFTLEKAAELGDEAARGGRLTEFELCCEKVESSFFDKAKYASFGAEAVIAYFGALESEITAARMILTCKLAGVSPELVRERLCD